MRMGFYNSAIFRSLHCNNSMESVNKKEIASLQHILDHHILTNPIRKFLYPPGQPTTQPHIVNNLHVAPISILDSKSVRLNTVHVHGKHDYRYIQLTSNSLHADICYLKLLVLWSEIKTSNMSNRSIL